MRLEIKELRNYQAINLNKRSVGFIYELIKNTDKSRNGGLTMYYWI